MQVRTAIAGGAASVQELSARLGVGTACGCCRDFAADLLAEAVRQAFESEPGVCA